MPHETLPVFWQDWILPWAPQNYVGLGLRDILFMEAGAWNAGSGPLAVTGLVEACLMVVAAFIPKKQKAS